MLIACFKRVVLTALQLLRSRHLQHPIDCWYCCGHEEIKSRQLSGLPALDADRLFQETRAHCSVALSSQGRLLSAAFHVEYPAAVDIMLVDNLEPLES